MGLRRNRELRRPSGLTPQTGGPGGGFLPTNLAGCVLWLRADKGITIGTGVSAWADQSGSGNNVTQASGPAQPTFNASGGANGTPYLAFASASSQALRTAGLISGLSITACTIFSIQQASALTAATIPFCIGNGGSNGLYLAVDGNLNMERDVVCGGVAADADSNNSATTSWEKWSVTSSSAPLQTLRVNGASRTLTPNNSASIAPTVNTTIGGSGSGAAMWNGSIAEIIVYSSVLSAANISSVESYLFNRYQI